MLSELALRLKEGIYIDERRDLQKRRKWRPRVT